MGHPDFTRTISLEPCGRECGQVAVWGAAFNHCCQDFCGDGSEEDAIAEMAGGDVVAGRLRLAEDGERVGSSGAQAGPVLEDLESLGEIR